MSSDGSEFISRYGAIIEATGNCFGTFESILPASKDVLKRAILEELALLAVSRQLTPAIAETLKTGYVLLATFVPADDARVLMEFSKSQLEAEHRDPLEWLETDLFDRATPIMQRIVDDQGELLTEVEEFMARVEERLSQRPSQGLTTSKSQPESGGFWSRLLG